MFTSHPFIPLFLQIPIFIHYSMQIHRSTDIEVSQQVQIRTLEGKRISNLLRLDQWLQ